MQLDGIDLEKMDDDSLILVLLVSSALLVSFFL
jgi:hypothetical protein